MNYSILIIYICLFFNIYKRIYFSYSYIIIFLANNFKNWSLFFQAGTYVCKNSLKCIFTTNFSNKVNYALYNAWTKYIYYNFSHKQKLILWSNEKMSWKKEMIKIGLGLSKTYYGGIDYRLFYSPNHFSYSYLGKIKKTLKEFINNAKKNINDLQTFISRKSIIYIQSKYYPKRSALVKRIMNNLDVDSFGKDLNNKKWPKGKSKVDLIKNYKFCLAIENSIQTSSNNKLYSDDIDLDYSTEKLYDCLEGGSIPVYYGPKNSYLFLPNNHSSIIMGEFDKVEDIVDYIKNIINSKQVLSKYISWINDYSLSWYIRFSDTYRFTNCKFCQWAYDNNN